MPKIIYLNGPSSSGKTTLAKALQESLEEPYLHIGIDKVDTHTHSLKENLNQILEFLQKKFSN